MNSPLQSLAEAYREGGVKALESEAARCMPPAGAHGWVDELIAGCSDPTLSVPATWLLLQHARKGSAIPALSVERLVLGGLDAGPNDARLHIAQLIQHIEVPKRCAKKLAEFLIQGCDSDHAFLRAWAMDGLYRLGLQHASFRELADEALERAASDPKASVKARARRLHAEDQRRS